MSKDLKTVIQALGNAGLDFRGAFHPDDEDGVPDCGFASGVRTLVLVGNIGGNMWPAFVAGRRDEPDALDSWTKRELGAIAVDLDNTFGGVAAFYPSDGPPYLPFQRWAMRGDDVHASPIGPLVHPEYGLWHAYRGVLVFQSKLELVELERQANPCEACADKPCTTSCPVDAIGDGRYDVKACATFMTTPQGDACLKHGCLARGACPVGPRRPYPEDQTRFHMGIFRDKYA